MAEAFACLILDARYERVREAGVIDSKAVLIAIGIDWDGRRQVLAVELANRESRSSWRDFLLGLKVRGLHGVEFVVADDHAGLGAALREALAEAAYQRCYVHFLRNAFDYVPRLQELRWLSDRRDLPEARCDLAAWLAKWSGKYPKLTGWLEENIDETLTLYRLPRQHHKHLKSTDEIDKPQLEMNSGFFVRPGGAVFLSRPGSGGCRAQRRSRVTAGHRAAARDAPLTASSTARRLAKPGAIVARDPLHTQVTIVIALGCTGDRVAKSRDRGCKPGRAAFSVAPRLRHPCAGLSYHAAAIGSRTARKLVRHGGRARFLGRAAP